MLLVLLAALGLGWLSEGARVQREAVDAIRKAGGTVVYDWQRDQANAVPPGRPGRTSPGPRWLVDQLGVDYFASVVEVRFRETPESRGDDALLERIGRLHRLEVLNLYLAKHVTDAGLAHIRGLTRLRRLLLTGSGVRGPGLAHLRGMTRLGDLDLNGLPVGDDDLAHLAGLTSLYRLDLDSKRVTDAGCFASAGNGETPCPSYTTTREEFLRCESPARTTRPLRRSPSSGAT